nr:unnamed protein product [Callosobruchus chinensis]
MRVGRSAQSTRKHH